MTSQNVIAATVAIHQSLESPNLKRITNVAVQKAA